MRRTTRLAVYGGFGVALAAVPVGYSPAGGVQVNEACAEQNCCPEFYSMCIVGGKDYVDYYFSEDPCGMADDGEGNAR